jgi:hypothetical protein
MCPDVQLAPPSIDALAWRACGSGCRELDVEGEGRIFDALGGRAADGSPWLALLRDRGGAHDLILYRGDAPVFAARMTKGFGGCLVRARAIAREGLLVEALEREPDGRRRRVLGIEPGNQLAGESTAPRPPLETVLAAGHRYETTTRSTLDVDGAPAWTAPAGVLISDLVAYRGGIVFTETRGEHADLQRWDGAKVHTIAADAGAPATDGTDLVWFGDRRAPALYVSHDGGPPRRLRAAHQDYVDAGIGIVGDGYAAHLERALAEPHGRLIVTRLADGSSWEVPARPGMHWGRPLWIARGEVAVMEEPQHGGDPATIARLTLASIGR